MKHFSDFIEVTTEHFERMERRVNSGESGVFVDDGRELDKSIIYEFTNNNQLNSDDIWKFYVYYKYYWIASSNTKDWDNEKWSNYTKEMNDLIKLFSSLKMGDRISGKYHKITLDGISLKTNSYPTVNIKNPIIIERILKAIQGEFKDNKIKPTDKSKRSDAYTKEYSKGLLKLFEYLEQYFDEKNTRYSIILKFLLMIDEDLFKVYSLDWIRKNLKP